MKLCVAYAGDVSQPTGGTNRVTALTGGVAEAGMDVTLVVPEPEGPLPARLDSVEVRTVDPSFDNGIGRGVAVARKAVRVTDPNTHLQFEHSLLGGIGAFLTRSRPILDMHDLAYARFDHVEAAYAPLARRGVAQLERYATTRADHIIAVSENMRTFIIDEWDVAPANVTVIPNGYFPDVVNGVRDIDVMPGRVCFLGTLHPKVDVTALRQIADLPATEEMVVIGDGAQRQRLETLASEHPELSVTGRLPDQEAFETVASAEVVVNPQQASALQRSSSPVKLYYYAALGKPIVTTRGPSVAELLRSESAARAPESREGFIQDVSELLESDPLASTLGENAREVARSFRWSERVDAVADLYRSLSA